MKSFKLLTLAGALAMLFLSPAVLADGRGHWDERGYGHDRGHHHHHHHGHGPKVVVIRERPVYYAPPPPPPVVYHQPRVVYSQPYPAYRYGANAGPLPIIAGGVLGGVVGEQLGRGDHGAIIGGSVLGAVLGNEIAR